MEKQSLFTDSQTAHMRNKSFVGLRYAMLLMNMLSTARAEFSARSPHLLRGLTFCSSVWRSPVASEPRHYYNCVSDGVSTYIMRNSQTKQHLTTGRFNPINFSSSSSCRSNGNTCGVHSADAGLRFGLGSDAPDTFSCYPLIFHTNAG
jgi:hypothetical protein